MGFPITGPLPTRPVAGSSSRGREDGIAALGITPEPRLTITATEFADSTEAILFDLPGRTAETVVRSAHLDGHDLAESAMDNAAGVAVALAAARALAPPGGAHSARIAPRLLRCGGMGADRLARLPRRPARGRARKHRLARQPRFRRRPGRLTAFGVAPHRERRRRQRRTGAAAAERCRIVDQIPRVGLAAVHTSSGRSSRRASSGMCVSPRPGQSLPRTIRSRAATAKDFPAAEASGYADHPFAVLRSAPDSVFQRRPPSIRRRAKTKAGQA